jgi:hypothetical protein
VTAAEGCRRGGEGETTHGRPSAPPSACRALPQDAGRVSTLWELPEARRILARQKGDGSWQYPGGIERGRSRENYDQLETYRQLGVLVEKFGFTRRHPAIERAAERLFTFQSEEGDFRGIYGNQYATTYVGTITELLLKAGYDDDPRITSGMRSSSRTSVGVESGSKSDEVLRKDEGPPDCRLVARICSCFLLPDVDSNHGHGD